MVGKEKQFLNKHGFGYQERNETTILKPNMLGSRFNIGSNVRNLPTFAFYVEEWSYEVFWSL